MTTSAIGPGSAFINGSHVPYLFLDHPSDPSIAMSLSAPSTLGSSYTLSFPANMGTTGFVLATDGNSATFWYDFSTTPNGPTGITGASNGTGAIGSTGPTGHTGPSDVYLLQNYSTGTQTMTNTYTNVTGLGFTLGTTNSAGFMFHIVFQSTATDQGYAFAMNGPAGATVEYQVQYQTTPNTTASTTAFTFRKDVAFQAMPNTGSAVSNAVNLLCKIEGNVVTTTTGGFVTVQAAGEGASNLTIQLGSWGMYFTL